MAVSVQCFYELFNLCQSSAFLLQVCSLVWWTMLVVM